VRRRLILLLSILTFAAGGASGQEKGRGQPQINPRVTPLGTQRPKPDSSSKKKDEPAVSEKPKDTVERAVNAHGGRQKLTAVRDSVSEGKLTHFGAAGARNTVDVAVLRKGNSKVQRVLKQASGETRQGSNGITAWESSNGMTMLTPGGLANHFIESQTTRAIDNLLGSQESRVVLRELGKKNSARVVEVESAEVGKAPRKTKYFVEDDTSQVSRVEWVTREAKDMFGKVTSSTESFIYSDYRLIQGIPTPFRIERFIDGLKIEETQFTSVRYNTDLKDDLFRP
jgi:hypothetical protein